jgi:hypothetical protein
MKAATGVLAHRASKWPERAKALTVDDAKSYRQAGDELKGIKALRAEIEDTFKPIVQRAHATWKEALAQRARLDDPLNLAEKIYKGLISAFDTETARKDLEDAWLRRKAQEFLAMKEQEAEAMEAEAAGASAAEVAAIVERELYVPPVQVERTAPKMAGIVLTETWKAEIVDFPALIGYVAANPQFMNLLQPNDVAIGGMARALKSTMAIPGIKAYPVAGVAARRA